MSNLQLVLVGVGVLIALSSYGKPILDFVISKFKKKSDPVIVFPDTPIVEPVKKEVSADLSEIVTQWEVLNAMLLSAGMTNSAKELKELLIQMATEYKQDIPVAKPMIIETNNDTANISILQTLMSK